MMRRRPASPRGAARPDAPVLLAGAGAVALLLFGTRWGSYLGFGGMVFLSDVLMSIAVLLTVLRSARGGVGLADGARAMHVPWLVLATGGYAVLRLLLGGDFSLIAIRDAAPYIYVLVGLLSFYAIRRATHEQRQRTARLLVVALVLHASWYSAQLAFPSLPDSLPVVSAAQGLHVFSERPDVDTTLIGVLAGYLLWRALRFRRRVPLLLLAYAACWVPIGLSSTRAGVLGAVVCTGLVLLLMLSDRRRSSVDRGAVAVVVLVAALIGAGLLLSSSVGAKFVATVVPSTAADSSAAEGGAGTARARSQAWDRLLDWTASDPARFTAGVGFGPDFLVDSGASLLLVHTEVGGDTVPRSPHNYWLGSFARLGLIGLILLVLLTVSVLRRIWICRAAGRDDAFVLIAASVFVALILPASLGVVLESPFGAVPFWWVAGCVLGLPASSTPMLLGSRRLGSRRPAESRAAVPTGQSRQG